MCGIAGFAGEGTKGDLAAMAMELVHRGPDDEGFFHVPSAVGFAFRRLAIIDLSKGNQPLSNEDGTVVVIFNGEIYNFRTLRADLAANHTLRTAGDSEVIVHLYEEHGERVFEHLNGMFTIALWDANKKTLLLARDRFGEKPLYYAVSGETLIFGSEPKALLRHPLVKPELDMRALDAFLSYEYVPSPHSIFRRISKLEPGTFLSWNRGSVRIERYYEPTYTTVPLSEGTLADYTIELEKRIRSSVSERLVSDVPLGLFLSGGLDSSTVCYYAREILPGRMKTFSIGYTDASFDESKFARDVAALLGTEHFEHLLSEHDLTEALPGIFEKLDEPISDPSIVPNYLLSQFARKHVTVVLGGDGGDEIFLGYPTFQAHVFASLASRIPAAVRHRIIRPLVERMPVSFGHIPFDYRVKRFFLGLEYPRRLRDLMWIGAFTPEEKSALFTDDARVAVYDAAAPHELVPEPPAHVREAGDLAESAYFYLRYYLGDGVLTVKDRASMYASLELRAPLLDLGLVDYMNSLPNSLKRRGLTTKYLLKKLMEGKLPNSIVHRAKKGFGVPVARWLAGALKPFMCDVLNSKTLAADGIFRPREVQRLMEEHLSGRRDHRKKLWTLLVFQIWKTRWLK